MFCTSCGKQLQEGEAYCPICGAVNEHMQQEIQYQQVQQYQQPEMQYQQIDNSTVSESKAKEKKVKKVRESKEKSKKSKTKKALFIIIPVAIVVIVAVILIVSYLRPVEFKDEIVDLAVHDALGKEPNEKIYRWELKDVEELYIDDSYTVGRYIFDAGGTHSFTPYMDIDMSEIARLKNLKELTIVNDRFDKIYCLSALSECKKLESLTMYYLTDNVAQHRLLGHGCKELLEVIEGCPKLEYINTVSAIPQELKEEAWDINDDIEFHTQNGESEEDEYEGTWPNLESSYKNLTEDGMVVIDFKEDPIPLEDYLKDESAVALRVGNISEDDWELIRESDSVRALYIHDSVDLGNIEGMDNLVSLTVAGYYSPQEFGWNVVEVENLDSLGTLENLTSLSLFACDVDGDIDVLDDIENLKFLSYWQMEIDLPENLDIYEDLIAFEYYSEEEEIDKYLSDMDNLAKLKVMFDEEIDISNLKDLRSLTMCPLLDGDLDMSMINKLKELRTLNMFIWDDSDSADWSDFKGLDKLEDINCQGAVEDPENIANCKKLRRVYMDVFKGHDVEDFSKVKYDFSDVAELEYLSYFAVTYSDLLRVDYHNYSGIKGLKEMDDRDVFINICCGRYSCNDNARQMYETNVDYLN